MEGQFKRADELAREILIFSRNALLVNLRYLDMALSVLKPKLRLDLEKMATDGEHFFYHPRYVLERFREERERSARDYLHMVMHCVFRHMFIGTLADYRLWDLSCDIAVESAIGDLNLRVVGVKNQNEMQTESIDLCKKAGGLTAEKLYRYFLDHPQNEDKLEYLESLFAADDHSVWYAPPEDENASQTGSSGDENDQPDNRADDEAGLASALAELEQRWKDISERMQQDLETFSKQQGDTAGNMMQNLREVNRERYDYSSFLKRFAVRTEVMKINDDEFDYIFYTYGLNLYKKMPLIEPLEYRDSKRIREFVIAIDTSGSTSGELVQKFVQKTYNILKSTETFASKINLHIIQCDAEIQEDVKITTQEEFDAYLKSMTIKGLGGTDFRPVFEYVEKLRKNREFSNLKGLIYFTDGYGDFPARKPDYDTAFVFIDDEYHNPNVPPWAIKLTLKSEEI